MSNAVRWTRIVEKEPDNFVIQGATTPAIRRRINDLGTISDKRELAHATQNRALMLECAAWYSEHNMLATARECQREADEMI